MLSSLPPSLTGRAQHPLRAPACSFSAAGLPSRSRDLASLDVLAGQPDSVGQPHPILS